MASSNTALRISELDYSSIRNNLKDFLRSQNEFTDFDFEGSGMAVLLDLLAYNTHYMAMQLNLVGNEMFLDTAQIRDSVVSHAKMINYVPTSKISASAKVNIQVTPGNAEDNTASTLTLDRYTRFLSNPISGDTFNFVAINSNTVSKMGDSFFFSNVVLKQGDLVSVQYLVDENNPERRFVVDSDSVDTTTLRVVVQESISNNFTTSYNLANDITELTSESTVYFVEENSLAGGNYTIYFGDGVLGKYLSNGNIVLIDYLVTQGFDANKASEFTAIEGVGDYQANVQVDLVAAATGGGEKESIDNIKFRAPIAYTAQNRAVNNFDYEVLLLKDYPNIEAITVWGGDENVPPVYGKVFISMKPVENYVITNLEKERIKDEIIANRAVLTVFPEIVDPDYTYLLIRTKVFFNSDLTILDEEEIKSLVQAAIIDYKNVELKQFNSVFRKSRLQRYIDNAHPSISSCELNVIVQKRFDLTLDVTKNYTVKFNLPLAKGNFLKGLTSYPEITVYDKFNTQRNVLIEEIPSSFTGIDSINIVTQGFEYDEVPTVTIIGDGIGAEAVAKLVNRRVSSIEIINRGINYSKATVSITGGGSGFGATAVAILQARNGTLRSYYYRPTGEKIIVNDKVGLINYGTINYDTGIIILNSLTPLAVIENQYYDDNVLTISVEPQDDTITSSQNRILDIDENDPSSINIEVIREE